MYKCSRSTALIRRRSLSRVSQQPNLLPRFGEKNGVWILLLLLLLLLYTFGARTRIVNGKRVGGDKCAARMGRYTCGNSTATFVVRPRLGAYVYFQKNAFRFRVEQSNESSTADVPRVFSNAGVT